MVRHGILRPATNTETQLYTEAALQSLHDTSLHSANNRLPRSVPSALKHISISAPCYRAEAAFHFKEADGAVMRPQKPPRRAEAVQSIAPDLIRCGFTLHRTRGLNFEGDTSPPKLIF